MIVWAIALLTAAPADAKALSVNEARRGAAAVGARTSDAPAIRAAADQASPSFALGASVQAWRNAAAAVAYDTTHVTGDGGDAQVRAEDCSDERIAFRRLEQRRQDLDVSAVDAAAAAAQPRSFADQWTARRAAPPAACS